MTNHLLLGEDSNTSIQIRRSFIGGVLATVGFLSREHNSDAQGNATEHATRKAKLKHGNVTERATAKAELENGNVRTPKARTPNPDIVVSQKSISLEYNGRVSSDFEAFATCNHHGHVSSLTST